MQDFPLYFGLGREHILDWRGYDHILFLLALCGVYLLSDWKRVLLLVTAFTIGHSLTLALSVFNAIHIGSNWIEFLIPLTIIVTSLLNLNTKSNQDKRHAWVYVMALFFGLIHGMGFSGYLKSLLGADTTIVTQLLAFNLGLEFGQIIIVITILALAQLLVSRWKLVHREWIIFLSAATFSLALQMCIERLSSLIN